MPESIKTIAGRNAVVRVGVSSKAESPRSFPTLPQTAREGWGNHIKGFFAEQDGPAPLCFPVEVAYPSELMYRVGPVFHLKRKLGWPEMP